MKCTIKNIVFLLLAIATIPVDARAQQTFAPRLEQISLQTDRSLYLTGESIWFSGFYQLLDVSDTRLSKVLYIELFNNQLEVVASQKLEISGQVVSGKIEIPDQLKTGYYLLRAYTRYQQNFPVWEMETHVISIINPNHPLPGYPMIDLDDQIELTNTTQGGLAFRMHEPLNKQTASILIYVNGVYTNSPISYYENGLGKIDFQPQEHDQIQLQVVIPQGDTIKSMVFDSHPGNLHVEIEADQNQLHVMLERSNLQNENLIIDVENITTATHTHRSTFMKEGTTRERFPFMETGIGLLQITVSDLTNNMLAHRYYFAARKGNNSDTSETSLEAEAGATFRFNLPETQDDNPLNLSFVLSGTTDFATEDLPNYLLNNPLYLNDFVSQKPFLSEKLVSQIDILLALQKNQLTRQLTDTSHPFVVPEIFGINLEGRLQNTSTKKPLPDQLVYCTVLGADPQFHATRTSRDGTFVIPLNRLENRQSIFVGMASEIDGEANIVVHSGYCTTPPVWNSTAFLPDTSYRTLIKQMLLNQQVSEAFQVCRSDSLPLHIPWRPLFGTRATTIKLADFVQLSSTQEVFNELVPYVKARKKDGHFKLVVLDEILNMEYDDPLLMVDQVPFNNIDEIMKLQPTEIEKIEVISRIYAHGNTLFNGIIVITTGAGNLAGMPLPAGNVFVEYDNFNTPILFSTDELPQHEDKPRFMNTVLWKNVIQPAERQINLTAPQAIANYNLIVRDLGSSGQIVKYQKVQVKKAPGDK